MKTYIYMNHHLKDKANLRAKEPEPIITVQRGTRRTQANQVRILGPCEVCWGNLPIACYNVKAWIETTSKVEVVI
jgi:hypothetical protein